MGDVSVREAPARAGGEGAVDSWGSCGGKRRATMDEGRLPRGQRHSETTYLYAYI